ncbi:hypothetical protein EVAR_90249_1 [Eumeta japonica]|uniref:Uncharacterized protein n=1 Tax=Eumeta variegata TaxID=151549 RepID=A0A4C1YRL6_EUMVA|nr:hypothetical protein EVAR_90249_1 [Eumeta japonica]
MTKHGLTARPQTKQQSTIWIYRDEPKLSKVARERSASKRMIVSFNKTGHVANVTLENCRNVHTYAYLCRSEFELPGNDAMRGFNAPRPFLLLPRVPVLAIATLVTNFIAAEVRTVQRTELCCSKLLMNDVMRRFNAPYPSFFPRVPVLRHCDAFVINFTA